MRALSLTILSALALIATGLSAEIAPQALWSALRSGTPLVSATGGTERAEGDTLRVEGPAPTLGTGPSPARIEAETLVRSPDGDGTRMTLLDRFTVRRGDLSYEVTAPGLGLIATGTPEDPAYRIDASRLTAEGPGVAGGMSDARRDQGRLGLRGHRAGCRGGVAGADPGRGGRHGPGPGKRPGRCAAARRRTGCALRGGRGSVRSVDPLRHGVDRRSPRKAPRASPRPSGSTSVRARRPWCPTARSCRSARPPRR